MDVPRDEHEWTLAFAEIALQQMRALRQPALPRNFEIWYRYATGYDHALNRSINQLLADKGALDDADMDQIYDTFFSPSHIGNRIDSVSSRMMTEIKQVLDMIDAAAGSATSYSASLADASATLQGANDGATLRSVIERLLAGANAMETTNKKLEARLSASRQEIEQLRHNLETVRSESRTDPLTTLANRKFFDSELGNAVAEAKHSGEPLALFLSDVDHFKSFNDKFGHSTGDQVLRLVATTMKQSLREEAIAARYGGEEFAVALPNTELGAALTVADRIRRAVMTKELVKRSSGERLGRVTLSIGVAQLRPDDTPQSLIERADSCLYAAKRAGRNRAVGENDAEAGGATPKARVA